MSIESTAHLLEELRKVKLNPQALQTFQESHPVHHSFHSLADYLNHYLYDHPDLEKPKLYLDSNLKKSYGDQFFNGYRKHPDKYKLIPLCIAMGMDLTETGRALRLAQQPALDPRKELDMALIICINQQVRSMDKVNDFLAECGLEPLY
jgi:hypothetical protein